MPDGFLQAVAAVINVLFLVAGIYIYLALARQVGARTRGAGETAQRFAWPDAILAAALGSLFALNAAASTAQSGKMTMGSNDLIFNGLVSAAMFVFVAAFLQLRGLSVALMAGFSKLGFVRTLMTGTILLFAAYPLIFLADLVTQRLLGGTPSKQGIVELFNDSQTLQQRALIIILAVAVAPVVEEFLFRFFLYGVVKRYCGRLIGLAANSLLFAAVHAHAPSAAPLFVLGACFTLAYEWSGSILVAMTMHALFNALTLTALAFPELLPQ